MTETRKHPEPSGEPYPIPPGSIINWPPHRPTRQFTDDEGFTYPTYRDSEVHYETNDLAQLIVGDGKFARTIHAKISGNTSTSLNKEDILQEVALSLMKTYRRGPPDYLVDEPSICKLIFTLINARISNAYRRAQRKGEYDQVSLNTNDSRDLDTFEVTLADEQHDVAEEGVASITQKEQAMAIQALRSQLSDGAQRIIDIMLAHPNLSGKERAELLQMTHGAYRVALHRIRTRMRDGGKRTDSPSSKPPTKKRQKRPNAEPTLQAENMQESPFSGSTTIDEVVQQLHLEIQSRRANDRRVVELSAPAYIGQWALGAANLRMYLEQEEPATAAIVAPDSQLDELTAYLAPLLKAHKKRITFLTADDIRWAQRGYFDYAVMSTDIDPSVLPKLRTQGNFVLSLCCLSDVSYDVIRVPGYKTMVSDTWSASDSIRYIQEVYFALGRVPSLKDVRNMHNANQGPPAAQLLKSDNFTNTEELVKKSLDMLKSKKVENRQ